MRLREQLSMGGNHGFTPRLTYASRHPGRAAARRIANDTMDRVSPMRRRRARRRARFTGLGAAMLAIPIGIWIGRMIFADHDEEPSDWTY